MPEAEPACILVLDDEPDTLENCQRMFALWGHTVYTSKDSTTVVDLLRRCQPDLVFTDLIFNKVDRTCPDGITVVEQVRRVAPDVPVIVITGYPTVESAVEAVKKGAFDYITKPFTLDLLQVVTNRALEKRRLTKENAALRVEATRGMGLGRLIGVSKPMREVFDLIRKVAPLDANVVISGESGTGKELAARAIHHQSRRANKHFVPIDCAALPETLLESELFGHQKGAFTGAVIEKAGLLEFANEGTLFLDEIGELTLAIQSKLLRVLQERVFRHIGGHEMIETDIRLIAATNADLAKKVETKEFREDLYYRLNVINIVLPPLRNRREDIPLLVHHFIQQFGATHILPIQGIVPGAMLMLQTYHWPGNVRELQNAIERAVALAEGEYLDVGDFPEAITQGAAASTDEGEISADLLSIRKRIVRDFERDYVVRLLKENAGNVSAAARQGGIHRRTLYRLMQRYGIDIESVR